LGGKKTQRKRLAKCRGSGEKEGRQMTLGRRAWIRTGGGDKGQERKASVGKENGSVSLGHFGGIRIPEDPQQEFAPKEKGEEALQTGGLFARALAARGRT